MIYMGVAAGPPPPAGQFELIGTNADLAALARAVPEGARFSIDVTDAEIEAWLNSRGYTGSLRTTARTIAIPKFKHQSSTVPDDLMCDAGHARNPAPRRPRPLRRSEGRWIRVNGDGGGNEARCVFSGVDGGGG